MMNRNMPSAADPVWHWIMPNRPLSARNAAALDLPKANDIAFGTCVRIIFHLFLAMIILAATSAEIAHAQGSAVYLATYVEVMPGAEGSGAALLARYRDASREEDGNQRFDVLHEIERPNRSAILEVWKDKAAFDGHDKAASKLHFRDSLKAIQSAPYDERVSNGIYVDPATSGVERGQSMSLPMSTSCPLTRTIA
jgi:quinol monooxygenase YgiN